MIIAGEVRSVCKQYGVTAMRLLRVLAGIGVELRFTPFGAEVIRLPVELTRSGGLRRIDLHSANNVFFH